MPPATKPSRPKPAASARKPAGKKGKPVAPKKGLFRRLWSGTLSAVGGYFDESRNGWNMVALVAPLFVVYQVGVLFTNGWRNGADFVTPNLIRLLNNDAVWYFGVNAAVFAVCAALYFMRRSRNDLAAPTPWLMFFESLTYAISMGMVATKALRYLNIPEDSALAGAAGGEVKTVTDAIVMSVGAGAYEELLFRVILLGGMVWLLRNRHPLLKYGLPIIVSALLFSAAHLVPIGIEPWSDFRFGYRLILGLILGLLFVSRGFAIAVYTHTLYDIIVLVPRLLLGL